jgi:hypothetical protein
MVGSIEGELLADPVHARLLFSCWPANDQGTNPQLRTNMAKRGVLAVKLAWGIRSGETYDVAFSGCASHELPRGVVALSVSV